MNRARPSITFALVLSALVVACGAAEKSAPPAASPASESTPAREPRTVEEAQADLEKARADLDRANAATSPNASAPADVSPSAQSTQEPRTRPATPSATPSYGNGGAAPPSPCEQACRALASMRHAKDAICRLTSDSDARCAQATKTVGESEAKLTQCGCPK